MCRSEKITEVVTLPGAHEADPAMTPGIDSATEMQIDDRVYNVSSFMKKHPGGSVIKFQLGTDASDAYHAFHPRSKKADMLLASLPSRPAEGVPAVDPLTADFRKLRSDLQKEGYFQPDLAHVAFRVAEVVALFAVGISLVWSGFFYAGAAMMGVAQGRCGWLQHEGGHYSLTGNIKIDRHLQMAIYGLGCGMSGAYWRNQHNKHHATPQKLKHDVDLETMPLLAFHKAVVPSKAGMGTKAWIALQAPLFFGGFTTLLVAYGWQFFQHPRHSLRVKNNVELGYMGLRYAGWAALFGYMGLGAAAWLYTVHVAIGASYIFINFAVSHTHRDVVPANKHISWTLYSANHTTNCTPSWWCNWWMAYLNFQIEHHLFPAMPQYRHPQICHRVKALFDKHGVEYDVRPYTTCMAATFQNLWDVGD